MVKTLQPDKLAKLQSLGYQGDGDLESIIEWLGDDFISLNKNKQGYVATGVLVAEHSISRIQTYPKLQGLTALEAVFNLFEAIHGGKEKDAN